MEVLDIPGCSVGIEEAFEADAGDTALGLLGGLEIASVLRDASALSLALHKNRALIRHQRVARRKGELAQP